MEWKMTSELFDTCRHFAVVFPLLYSCHAECYNKLVMHCCVVVFSPSVDFCK